MSKPKPVREHHIPFDLSNVKTVNVDFHNESPYQLKSKVHIEKEDDGTLTIHLYIRPKNEA